MNEQHTKSVRRKISRDSESTNTKERNTDAVTKRPDENIIESPRDPQTFGIHARGVGIRNWRAQARAVWGGYGAGWGGVRGAGGMGWWCGEGGGCFMGVACWGAMVGWGERVAG